MRTRLVRCRQCDIELQIGALPKGRTSVVCPKCGCPVSVPPSPASAPPSVSRVEDADEPLRPPSATHLSRSGAVIDWEEPPHARHVVRRTVRRFRSPSQEWIVPAAMVCVAIAVVIALFMVFGKPITGAVNELMTQAGITNRGVIVRYIPKDWTIVASIPVSRVLACNNNAIVKQLKESPELASFANSSKLDIAQVDEMLLIDSAGEKLFLVSFNQPISPDVVMANQPVAETHKGIEIRGQRAFGFMPSDRVFVGGRSLPFLRRLIDGAKSGDFGALNLPRADLFALAIRTANIPSGNLPAVPGVPNAAELVRKISQISLAVNSRDASSIRQRASVSTHDVFTAKEIAQAIEKGQESVRQMQAGLQKQGGNASAGPHEAAFAMLLGARVTTKVNSVTVDVVFDTDKMPLGKALDPGMLALTPPSARMGNNTASGGAVAPPVPGPGDGSRPPSAGVPIDQRGQAGFDNLADKFGKGQTARFVIDNVEDGFVQQSVCDQIKRLRAKFMGNIGGAGAENMTYTSSTCVFNTAPLDDLEAFAKQIDFAEVLGVNVEARRVSLTVTAAFLAGLTAPPPERTYKFRKNLRPGNDREVNRAVVQLASKEALGGRGEGLRYLREVEPIDSLRETVNQALVRMLKTEEDAFTLHDALQALAVWGDASSAPALIDALGHRNSSIANRAADALAEIDAPDAAEAIARLLKSDRTRHDAVEALKRMATLAEPAVIPYLKESDEWTKRSACEILKVVGGRASVKSLEDCLAEAQATQKDSLVEFAAKDALSVCKRRRASVTGKT